MAVVQSTYATDHAVGFLGMVANGETSNRISRTVEDATAIAFGRPVWRGAGDHGCILAATAGTLLGITIANYAVPPVQSTGANVDSYPQYATAGILTQGVIWVTAGEAVTDGAQAYAVPSTGVIVDTSTDNVIMPGWFFDQTVASGALVRLAKR